MAIKGIFYVLAQVSDLARSKKFYADTLGWKLNTDETNVAGFAFGSAYLVILEVACGEPHTLDATRSGASARTVGGLQVEVQVDDVDAEHTRLRKLGVEVGELCDRPWGERNFSFHDPDGHIWSYGQATHDHH
jgi:catechol 2,3-dioxygenase-like lactoylglutathione lyase family enzyme